MGNYKYCPKCGEISGMFQSYSTCSLCKIDLIETDMEYNMRDWIRHEAEITQQIYDKYKIKDNPLYDPEFVAKREKHDEEVHKRSLAPPTRSANKITCPYCKSTNVKKISTTSRVVSTGLFGLASKKIGKQWHCNGCGSDF